MDSLKEELLSKPWFGFDLDNTLHSFRRASNAALTAPFTHIAVHHNILLKDLKPAYKTILQRGLGSNFTDGRTSSQYRKERFRELLEIFDIIPTSEFLDTLTDSYKAALGRELELKAGAKELLGVLKESGKMIVVITEGPEDAQKWTLEMLGLWKYVDFLATSNKFRVSKTGGLFGQVLERLGIEGREMVFVGDSFKRDIEAARKEGILAIYYSESDRTSFENGGLRVNSFETLVDLLSGEDEALELDSF